MSVDSLNFKTKVSYFFLGDLKIGILMQVLSLFGFLIVRILELFVENTAFSNLNNNFQYKTIFIILSKLYL